MPEQTQPVTEAPAPAAAAPSQEEVPVREEMPGVVVSVDAPDVEEEVPTVVPAPAAPAVQQPAAAVPPQGYPAMQQMGAPGMMMPQQPYPQAMMPQFMGYDASGKPVYAPVQQPYPQAMMPQFMGYDANGKPVYAQPMQQPMPQQPFTAPMAQPPQQPAAQQPVMPQQPVTPMPMPAAPMHPQGVRVSVVDQEAHTHMPDVVRSALAKSAAPQKNIFDQQGGAVPVMDNIEDILSSMGEDTSQFKTKKKEDPTVNLQYEEYKPRQRSGSRKKNDSKSASPDHPLTEEEKRDQKRREKIDAQFRKDLAKRGF